MSMQAVDVRRPVLGNPLREANASGAVFSQTFTPLNVARPAKIAEGSPEKTQAPRSGGLRELVRSGPTSNTSDIQGAIQLSKMEHEALILLKTAFDMRHFRHEHQLRNNENINLEQLSGWHQACSLKLFQVLKKETFIEWNNKTIKKLTELKQDDFCGVHLSWDEQSKLNYRVKIIRAKLAS